MKHFLPRAFFATAVLSLAQATTAPAQNAPDSDVPLVTVRLMKEVVFNNWIAADGVFRIKWPCIRVTLHSTADIEGSKMIGRAYFYDKDKNLILKQDKVPNANHDDGGYGLPPLLKARKPAEIYVPIETMAKERKWRNAVLVYGDKRRLTAEVYPRPHASITWKDFEFPERAALLEQEKAAAEAKKR